MVFEAVVVELLNKFLGQYIENLDTSQLKIGIWGGDVVLKDLKIKSTVFDDLSLPVRVKWGKLGKLALNIPWKNLYSAQVVVDIEGLLLVIIPNSEFRYDPVKEEKWAQDKKQARLRAIEEAKKRELETDPAKPNDGFVEKLLTQITKNLQVVIRNIHIRYEDKTTIPDSPFSVGVTMCNLSALTTLTDPTMNFSKLMQENENFICKVVNLEGLAIYWNSNSVLFSDLPTEDLLNIMIKSIPKADYKPEGFMYVFGPLSASGFVRLNPKPELDGSDFKIPKIFINIHLKEIELALTHYQFRDAMSYLQDFQMFVAANKYRKYRPVGISVIGHAREWWHFAYVAVLEDITRRRTEWSWVNIKAHREGCRRYSELFKLKLNSKKLTADESKQLAELEKKLNVFNLVLIREQVYVEVERTLKEHKSGGWFSSWFGYGTESKSDPNDELVKKIQSVMTKQEKQKLYKAIGYEESAPPTNYPINFVEIQFWFHLDEIKTTVYDDRTKHLVKIMTLSVRSVRMEFEQRPCAFAMKFVMIIGNFQVIGKQESDASYPELVTSNCKESESLIELLYETKPLNATCDHRVIVYARPLSIIYHANTINLVREVFQTESSGEMEKIVAATSASLPTFQTITSLGLQYAIEKRTELEVKVNIMSSYLIIPYGGVYRPGKDMLVLLLGKLSVETEENDKTVSVKKMHLQGTTDEEIFSAVVSASYTKFKCNLTGVQILFQLSGEDWVAASNMQRSALQFLEPTNLEVTIKKSLVMDDARIPKMIIEGKMPALVFNFQEERFLNFVALASSIPAKSEESVTVSKKGVTASTWSLQSLGTQLENKLIHMQKDLSASRSTEYVQGIDLVGQFEMKELTVNISKTKGLADDSEKSKEAKVVNYPERKFLSLRIVKMEMDITQKTFEVIHLFKLGGIEFLQFHKRDWLPFVSTKLDRDYLFVVEFIKLDTKIPDFYTAKGGIVNRLTLNITPLKVLLDKEALLAQIEFITNVQRKVELVRENVTGGHMADTGRGKETIFEETAESAQPDKKVIAKGKRFRKKTTQKEVIDFFLQARLDEINILVEFKGQGLAEFNLKGGSIDISTQKSYMTVDVNIQDIHVLDLNANTKHTKIVASLEEQTLSSRVTVYNKEYFGSGHSLDMSIDAEVGGIQCTYVTLFFARAFEFLNAFQSQIETFKEGATIAAQKAKENVVKAFNNAAQICLKIKITAPLLLIPKTSESLETLSVDLGVLTIKNSITELDYVSDEGTAKRPLIDTIKVHLHNLKMSSCTLSDVDMTPENERTFLVPVTFELNVKRNLSRSWFTVIPELEIVARLASVRVTLTHEDLCVISNVIRKNLEEGDQANMEQRLSSQTPIKPKISNRPKEQKPLHHTELTKELEEVTSEAQYSTVVKFMFFMDSFVFDALQTPGKKENGTGLARFVLEAMSLSGSMFSNNSIHTSIKLISCLLDDTRPGKEGRLTRLMERTVDPTAEDSKLEANRTNSMFEIIYYKKDMDCFIDVRVYKFTLILSMDFLQKLGVFFTLEDVSSSENVKQPVKVVDKHVLTPTETEIQHSTFTVNVRLEKPDIIFVENMDSVNVDALMFHTEMLLKYRLAGTKQVISGTLRDIELYSCCFNPSKRSHTMNQVIKPFTVSIAGSTPEGSGLHLDICVTDIFIRIDPSTVELILKCHEALLKDSSINEGDVEEEDYSDLWKKKQFDVDDFWFLKPEVAQDALIILKSESFPEIEGKSADQICLLAIPSINVLVEGVQMSRVQPLILLEMGFQMSCYNWSQRLTIMKSLTVQMQYYNKTVSSWEPLIEPVEKYSSQNKHSYIPWEINCSVVYEDEGELEELRPPKVQITLSCPEVLQVTVTKTCVEVLKTAIDRYTSAVTKHVVEKLPDAPPYVVKNETGLVVELLLEESKLQVCRSLSTNYNIVRLDSNSEVELQNIPLLSSELNRNASLSLIKKETVLFVKFPVAGDHAFELPLGQTSSRRYPFPPGDFSGPEPWSLVAEVSVLDVSTTVVLRSIFTIINYFNESINVHSLSENGTVAEYVGAVEGNSKFHLPFQTVYNENKKLFFSVNGYSLSLEPFDWSTLKGDANASRLLQCTSKVPENQDPFFIQAVGEAACQASTSTKRGGVGYKLHLQPTVKIFNSLSHPLVICFQGSAGEKLLQPGNKLQITNAEPGTTTITLRLSDYLEKEWSCKETIVENPSEFFIWKFVSYNGLSPEALHLGVHVTFSRKTAIYAIYSPFFLVNKTEQLLSYKFEHSSSVFHHPGSLKGPIMFSPTSKKFFSKKSASLKVGHSSWSDKFPIDVAGSGGTVECKHPLMDITYKISVTISLTCNSLTKVVVFSPFYVMINSMEFAIEYQECDAHHKAWLEIPPQSCIPFWPRSEKKDSVIEIRPKDSSDSSAVSPPFAYHSTDVCLLQLSHKCGGIFVKVKANQSGTYITFSAYEVGQAPALIVNYSNEDVRISELNTKSVLTLSPFEQVMYAWSCPTGQRKLSVAGAKGTNTIIPLNEDTEGIAFTEKKDRIRYVSFLDGTQRVLVFTQDLGVSRSISNMKFTSSGVEFICKLQGLGLSLVNDITRVEILYLTFVSSGITWETKKFGKNFYKKMKEEDASCLEDAYQKYLEEAEANSEVASVVRVSDKFRVDFRKMEMICPFERELRRTFESGFWLVYRQIENQRMLHVKINRIQIDSQLLDCVFPVILAPVPPPKSVAYQGPKPFFELSVVKIATDRSGVEQYKYFKTLIQEFHVKMDIGFIQHMYNFMAAEEMSEEQEKLLLKKDLALMEQPLKAHVEVVASNEQKNFYDLLHFSPIKIHFSFSMAGKLETNTYLPPTFSVLLQSLGVTLTDIHDVTFRLSYLERKSVFLSNRELLQEVVSHYYGQIVRQAYVLLLGLDVIGNPYGLIVGIGEGVEAFFYEPIQGMIQGPSEFGKGMAIGWKSLFGHTVGSAASSLGKITGTLGKGLAVLSLDKEYQMQRMVEQSHQGNIQSSMAQGGRSLFLGVLEGVSGVVQKPIQGAKDEGVGGFFKGMGKGMMGLVTRPVTGIVDFASTSLNAVKRATVITADNKRLRPPRYLRSNNLVEPYNTEDAQGYLIFYSIGRRKYCATDKYEYHSYLREKEVLLLTNKRIILAEYSDVFGSWQEHMSITWKSMPDGPRCHTKGVALTMPARSGVAKKDIKVLLIDDECARADICKKMIHLYNLEQEAVSVC